MQTLTCLAFAIVAITGCVASPEPGDPAEAPPSPGRVRAEEGDRVARDATGIASPSVGLAVPSCPGGWEVQCSGGCCCPICAVTGAIDIDRCYSD